MSNQDPYTDPQTIDELYFVHETLILEIKKEHLKGNKARTKVLWHCYDVMYNPPINKWDLEWRRAWGY